MTDPNAFAPVPPLLDIGRGFSPRVELPTTGDQAPWRVAAAQANDAAAAHATRVLQLVMGDALADVFEPGSAPTRPTLSSYPIGWWNRAGFSARVLRIAEMQALPESDRDKFRVVEGGAFGPVEPGRYMQSGGTHVGYPNWRPDAGAVAGLLASGAVANLNFLEDNDVLVRRISELIGRLSRSPVTVNCYISRDGPSGSGAHWDDHDVVLIQVMGTKRWVIGEPTDQHPIKGGGLNERSDRLVQQLDLNPGDALYLPRGFWHEGTSTGDLSIHLTIALSRPRTKMVAEYWLSTLDGTAEHRRDVSVDDQLPVSMCFEPTAARLASFWAGVAATTPCPTSNRIDLVSNLLALDDWTSLGLSARLPAPGGFAVRLGEGDRPVLAFGGYEVACSPDVAAFISFLGWGPCRSVDELVGSHGSSLDVVAVLGELLVAGLLDLYLGDELDWPLVEIGGPP
jgi:hypothetical protein